MQIATLGLGSGFGTGAVDPGSGGQGTGGATLVIGQAGADAGGAAGWISPGIVAIDNSGIGGFSVVSIERPRGTVRPVDVCMLVECSWSYQHHPRVGPHKQHKVDAAPTSGSRDCREGAVPIAQALSTPLQCFVERLGCGASEA